MKSRRFGNSVSSCRTSFFHGLQLRTGLGCLRNAPGLPNLVGARMEKVTETWVTLPERPISMTNRNACLAHIYPTGPGMRARYTLPDSPLVIGRGSDRHVRPN